MTAYIANHEKKNRIFAKRERELRHAIKHGFPPEKLMVAAERVRAAKIAVFKCRFSKDSENQPHNFSPEEIAVHDRQVQLWLARSADEIIEVYRREAANG
jgi:hypothetical protein